MTHNLEWRDIEALFMALGEVEHEHNGNLRVTVGGHSVVFHSPNVTDIATSEQVSQIRHFLHLTGSVKAKEAKSQVLVVMDHQSTRIFHTEERDAVADVIRPEDPKGHEGRVHSAHEFVDHNGRPHRESYFAAIAKSLAETTNILIFGSGTGSSSEMTIFMDWLKDHEPRIGEHVVGTVVVDGSHMTTNELLAKAREIYMA
jgi:hypothetical protein